MTTPDLTDRQRRILQAIVEEYISTAEPVGSRTISRHYLPEASPATIRNDMADLEELQLLEQPHTSAGRVPSDSGYRYYVNCSLGDAEVPADQARLIEDVLRPGMQQVESIIQASVEVLSEASNLISIVLGPQVTPTSLARIEVAYVAGGRALLVLVSRAGFVETKLVGLPSSLDEAGLRRMTDLLNGLLEGRTWDSVNRPGVLRDIRSELPGYESMLEETIEFLRASLEPVAPERLYISGMAHLLDLPEFQDLGRTKAILGLLDHAQAVAALLAERLDPRGVTVTIGRENKREEMVDCSLVSAPYHAGGRAVGGVAVLGPKRMAYRLVLPLVDLVAANLNDLMLRLA